jgi:hypothetical protein
VAGRWSDGWQMGGRKVAGGWQEGGTPALRLALRLDALPGAAEDAPCVPAWPTLKRRCACFAPCGWLWLVGWLVGWSGGCWVGVPVMVLTATARSQCRWVVCVCGGAVGVRVRVSGREFLSARVRGGDAALRPASRPARLLILCVWRCGGS